MNQKWILNKSQACDWIKTNINELTKNLTESTAVKSGNLYESTSADQIVCVVVMLWLVAHFLFFFLKIQLVKAI